jgi:hypothetical protein
MAYEFEPPLLLLTPVRIVSPKCRYLFPSTWPENPDAIVEQIRTRILEHGHLRLASTGGSTVVWKWFVDASGKDLAALVPHIPLPAVRFAPQDRTPHDILDADGRGAIADRKRAAFICSLVCMFTRMYIHSYACIVLNLSCFTVWYIGRVPVSCHCRSSFFAAGGRVLTTACSWI